MRKMKSQCRLCNASGWIYVQPEGDNVRIQDEIQHRPRCPKYRPRRVTQPAHLRKRRWVAQERKAAEAISGYETLMSGAANNDADARNLGHWRVECKQTKYFRFTVSQDVWTKLVQRAKEAGEIPVLSVILGVGTWREVTIYLIEGRPEDEAIHNRLDINSLQDSLGRCMDLTPPARVITEKEFKELVRNERDSGELSQVH